MINYSSLNYNFNLIYYHDGNIVLKLNDKNSDNWGFNFWNYDWNGKNLNFEQLVYYHNPIYKNYAFNYEINQIIIEDFDHYPKIYLNAKYNYKEYIFDQRTNQFYYSDYLPTDLKIDVNINDQYQEVFLIDQFNKFGENKQIILEPEIDCFENNLSINLDCSSSYGYHYNKSVYLNTKIKTDYNLNFTNYLFLDLYIPIYYQDQQIYYDRFYFLKLFRNNFYYPKKIKFLILFYYNDPKNWQISIENQELSGLINLKGINDNSKQFKINFYSYHNFFLFYVDDIYYYDYKNQESINGLDQNFEIINGICLPWDYENNIGYIEFNLSTSTFLETEINFNFYLPIKIKNSLRGNQYSKFQLIEVFDYSNFDDEAIIWEQYA